MNFKHRISKIERKVLPRERRKITVRLGREGDPGPKYPASANIIPVRLGAPEQNDAP